MGISSVLTSGLGIYQTIQGAKEKKDAQKALENYNRQEFKNVADNLQVSTIGADLKREEQARLDSSQIQALSGGGTRALVGGLGRVQAGNQAVNSQIAANLDEQQKNIDAMKAEDDIRIRSMKEDRENADISALSSQYQSGKNDMMMGIGDTIKGIGSIENKFEKPTDIYKDKSTISNLQEPSYKRGTRNARYGAIG